MATEAQIVAVLKKHPGESIPFYAGKLNMPVNSATANAIYLAEPVADPSLKLSGAKLTAELKSGSLRWERIAARSGKSVSELKAEYKKATGKDASTRYTGRGRRDFSGSGGGGTSRKAQPSGGRGRTTAGTSGRRQAAASGANKPAAGSGRRGQTTAKAGSGRRGADPK